MIISNRFFFKQQYFYQITNKKNSFKYNGKIGITYYGEGDLFPSSPPV